MDRYDEKCLELLVEKDPDISVLEFHLVELMFEGMGILPMFLKPIDLVDVFMGQKYVRDELSTKILNRGDLE